MGCSSSTADKPSAPAGNVPPKALCEDAIAKMKDLGPEQSGPVFNQLLSDLRTKADWSQLASGSYPYGDIYICARGEVSIIAIKNQVDAELTCRAKFDKPARIMNSNGLSAPNTPNAGIRIAPLGINAMACFGDAPDTIVVDLDDCPKQQKISDNNLVILLENADLTNDKFARDVLSYGKEIADAIEREGKEVQLTNDDLDKFKITEYVPKPGMSLYLIENESRETFGIAANIPITATKPWPVFYDYDSKTAELAYEPLNSKVAENARSYQMRANLKKGKKMVVGVINGEIYLKAQESYEMVDVVDKF